MFPYVGDANFADPCAQVPCGASAALAILKVGATQPAILRVKDISMNQTPQPKRVRLAKPGHSIKRGQPTDLPYGLKDNVMDAL